MQKRKGKIKINFKEAIKEVHNRTGLPENSINQVLESYAEVVKQCILNEVDVVFADIGTFGLLHSEKRENVMCRNFHTGEVFYKDIPPYNKTHFKFSPAWKDKVREVSSLHYAEIEKEVEENGLE